MDRFFVVFDDVNAGEKRIVGPFPGREEALFWISEAKSIASRDHRLEKRCSFQIAEAVEDPESTLSLINAYLHDPE